MGMGTKGEPKIAVDLILQVEEFKLIHITVVAKGMSLS